MIEDSGRAKERRGGRSKTAFYIEALILVALFAIVILVLTKVFAWSGQQSRDAALLTNAVHLAENGAEAVMSSNSLEEVQALLEENGNAKIETANEDASGEAGPRTLRVQYDEDLNPVPEGTIWMDIQWIPGASGEEEFVKSIITVNQRGRTESVYTLETEVYLGKEGEAFR